MASPISPLEIVSAEDTQIRGDNIIGFCFRIVGQVRVSGSGGSQVGRQDGLPVVQGIPLFRIIASGNIQIHFLRVAVGILYEMHHQISVGIIRPYLCFYCHGNFHFSSQSSQGDYRGQRAGKILLAHCGSLYLRSQSVLSDNHRVHFRFPGNCSAVVRKNALAIFKRYVSDFRLNGFHFLLQEEGGNIFLNCFRVQSLVPDLQVIHGCLGIFPCGPVGLSDLQNAAASQNIQQGILTVQSCPLYAVYVDGCVIGTQNHVNMYPVISHCRGRIGRAAIGIVVPLYGQVSAVVQESHIVLCGIQLGAVVGRRVEGPVGSGPLVFDVVGNCHFFQPGKKAGSVCRRHIQPLSRGSIQMQGTAALIAVGEGIAAGCFGSIRHDVLSGAQIFKIEIQQELCLNLSGIRHLNRERCLLFSIGNRYFLLSDLIEIYIAESKLSGIFGTSVVGDILRASVRVSYGQHQTCGIHFIRSHRVNRLHGSGFYFNAAGAVSLHDPVVLFRSQRDYSAVAFPIGVKVEIIVFGFHPFGVGDIRGVEGNISHTAVVVRQQAVGFHLLSVYFLPVILIVSKQLRSFQAGCVAGDIPDKALGFPYRLIGQPLAAVRTFFHPDGAAGRGSPVIIALAVSEDGGINDMVVSVVNEHLGFREVAEISGF